MKNGFGLFLHLCHWKNILFLLFAYMIKGFFFQIWRVDWVSSQIYKIPELLVIADSNAFEITHDLVLSFLNLCFLWEEMQSFSQMDLIFIFKWENFNEGVRNSEQQRLAIRISTVLSRLKSRSFWNNSIFLVSREELIYFKWKLF